MPLKHIRAAAFAAAVAVPAAAPAEAGLRDSLDNARDALGCTAKAVLNPMRVVEWGMRNFERMTEKEFDRKANRSVKEAQEECRIALKSIVARGFGVKPVRTAADKIKKAAGKAREAAGKVAGWFGKDSAPDDRRRALAIGGGERRFYEDAGVLGAKPLPKAKAPVPPADGDPGSPGGWDEAAAPAPDPWAADEDRTARSGVWDPPAEDRDPWGAAESTARDPFAPDPDVDGDGGEAADEAEGGDYADALAALERRAEEARRQAEREAELARQQAEREAEMARQREEAERHRAEREAELARQRAERAREEARQRAKREAEMARRERHEHAAVLQSLLETGIKLYAAKRGVELPSTAFSTPSLGGGAVTERQPSSNSGACDRLRQRTESAISSIRARTSSQSGASEAACGVVNALRAMNWGMLGCLGDPALSNTEKNQLRTQIAENRAAIRQSLETFRGLAGLGRSCGCWTDICAD